MVGKILRCIIGISERAKTNEWLDRLLKMGVEDAEAFAYGDGGHPKRSELEEAVRVAGEDWGSKRNLEVGCTCPKQTFVFSAMGSILMGGLQQICHLKVKICN